MPSALLRYLRLMAIFAGASISAQLEYRMNFVISALGSLLTAGGALFGLLILSSDGQPIGGWSYREATVVVGLFTVVQGFIGTLLYPNLNKIAEAVRLGTMDFNLLKPIDAQFLVSTRNINVFHLIDVLVGAALIGWAASGLEGVTLGGLLLALALVAAALMIVYAIWFALTTTAFWFVKVENVTELFNGVFRAGQFPVSVFPGWLRLFFTAIVPIAFITTAPAEAIIGRTRPSSALTAIGVALVLLLLARWFWKRAIGSYTSASS
jgi:ABC-2 type transport system permease protein